MKISAKRDYLSSMESVAITDVVLNMFIFFFISFSLLYTFNPATKKLDIKLPKAQSAQAMGKELKVIITISEEGIVYLEQQAVTMKELKDRILQLQKNAQLGIAIHADKSVEFEYVVDVLDILRDLDIVPVSIAVVEPRGGE